MIIPIKHTIDLKDGTTLNITGGWMEESGDIRLRLDQQSREALTAICRFPVYRAYLISTDGVDCCLYVERRGTANLPMSEQISGEDFAVFLFANELEAFGLYTLAQLAAPAPQY